MSRPELYRGSKLAGLAAVALFGVLAAVFLGADFGASAGFEGSGSITASIGYLMFDLGDSAAYGGEGFLAAFEIVDVVLVAALVGAVMLARRESSGPLEGGEE